MFQCLYCGGRGVLQFERIGSQNRMKILSDLSPLCSFPCDYLSSFIYLLHLSINSVILPLKLPWVLLKTAVLWQCPDHQSGHPSHIPVDKRKKNLLKPIEPGIVAVTIWKILAESQVTVIWKKTFVEGWDDSYMPSWKIWLKAEVMSMTRHE